MRLPTYVLRNGALVLPAQASISVFNPAIYGAFGVYESMQVANGVVFARDAHMQRLAHSAEIVGLRLPADLAHVRAVDRRGVGSQRGHGLHAASVCGRRRRWG